MSEQTPPYITSTTYGPARARPVPARERLMRRLMQAKRAGAAYAVVDLRNWGVAVAQKVETIGGDVELEMDITEAHE